METLFSTYRGHEALPNAEETMSNNSADTSPIFRLVMRIIGILVMLAPLVVLLVAPAPLGSSGDYVGPKGMAFLFFILSVPAGLLIIGFSTNPTRTKQKLSKILGAWAGFSVLALLGDLFNRLFRGKL